jgi:NADH-quinone oxidoreductase subunit N
MSLSNTESLKVFYPEIALAATILLILILDLVMREKKSLANLSLVGCVISLAACYELYDTPSRSLFERMVALDPFSLFFKVVSLLAAIGVIWMSMGSKDLEGSYSGGEYYVILLTSTLGMFLMASSTNLLMSYLSLETVSVTSYVLTGYLRRSQRSSEAALKYLIYGAFASGVMIYGISWIYGITGSLDYFKINSSLSSATGNRLAIFIALVLLLAGLGYKIAAVPFHMWSPDVYQGAPIPVTGFLSVASNAAGFAMLIRFFYPGISQHDGNGSWEFLLGVDWPQLLLFISMVTMTLGNLAALGQQNLKRLLAYSGISHAGYMLMGFVVLNNDGLSAMLFYLVVYLIMNLGAFLVVIIVANNTGREDVEGYRGLAWRGGAWPAVAMAVFLFSLTGLPPMSGFVGKFFLFAAVINAKLYWLAVVAVLNSVVSLYYYARIVKTMFLDFPDGSEGVIRVDLHNGALLGILTSFTILFGIYWGPVFSYTSRSLTFLMG